MVDKKISELDALASLTTDDLFVVVDDPSGTPATKKIAASAIFGAIPATLVPVTDSNYDLGSSAKYWGNGYVDKLYLNATAALDGQAAGVIYTIGHIVPLTSVTDSIGAFDKFFDKIWINAECYLTGSTAGKVTIDGTNGQLYVKGISQLVGGVYTDTLVGSTGGALTSAAIVYISNSKWCAEACAVGDLLMPNPANTTQYLKWDGSSEPRLCCGVATVGGGAAHTEKCARNGQVTVKCDATAVVKGDILIPSGSAGLATVDNAPDPLVAIGTALTSKGAGAGTVTALLIKG